MWWIHSCRNCYLRAYWIPWSSFWAIRIFWISSCWTIWRKLRRIGPPIREIFCVSKNQNEGFGQLAPPPSCSRTLMNICLSKVQFNSYMRSFLIVLVVEAKNLSSSGLTGLYCNVLCGNGSKRTRKVNAETNPIWLEEFTLYALFNVHFELSHLLIALGIRPKRTPKSMASSLTCTL